MYRLCLVECIAASLLPLSATAQEATPPLVGQRATYDCEGTFGGTYVYEVRSMQNDQITYDLTAPNKNRRTLVMPIWALGTSLYRKDYGEGYGAAQMTSGLDNFHGLKPLAVGTKIEGAVTEQASGSSARTWAYTVTIAERRQAHNEFLGDVEIVVIKEHRSTGAMSSEREAHLVPAVSELIQTHYEDSAGRTRDCELSGLERP